MRAMRERQRAAGGPASIGVDVTPLQMLGNPIFSLMFVMMTMMSTSGLMVISQMAAFTRDFGIARRTGVRDAGATAGADRSTASPTASRAPFFGWTSPMIRPRETMLIAFALRGHAMTLWLMMREMPLLFVLLSGMVFFGWGKIFWLFPPPLPTRSATRHATANYGFLYMAQGVGSARRRPGRRLLHEATANSIPVFAVIISIDFITAVLAIAVLKPLRRRWLEKTHQVAAVSASPVERADWAAAQPNS
ncbi:MAG: hypothetical protein QM757_05990 [Paludibaculum sp.]